MMSDIISHSTHHGFGNAWVNKKEFAFPVSNVIE